MTDQGTRPRSRRSRRLAIVVPTIVLSLCAMCAVPTWYVLLKPATSVEEGKPVQIEIPPGTSTAEMGEMLAEAGVVDNALMFRLRVRFSEYDGLLKAGVYDLATGMPYGVVMDRLAEGPPILYVRLTIPEGFTIDQIAERLEEQTGIAADEFSALAKTGADGFGRDHLAEAGGSLEGYLFPKTYRIREGATARDVITMMLDQFDKETAGLDMSHAASQGLTLHDIVTLASMIEKEAKLADERPLVASVIYNRLSAGMRLEIDATIEYVLPGHRFRLRNQDLKTDSPYNTYLHKGLPPGPIASPGLASLEAAAAPAETGYLYYVLTGTDGSHTFTTTREEFLAAKRKSKEVFGR